MARKSPMIFVKMTSDVRDRGEQSPVSSKVCDVEINGRT